MVKRHSYRMPGFIQKALIATGSVTEEKDWRDLFPARKWSVSHAETLQEAVRLAEHENFDIVVFTHDLPDCNPIPDKVPPFLQQVRQKSPGAEIIGTGGDPDQRTALMKSGCPVVVGPLSIITTLHETIEELTI